MRITATITHDDGRAETVQVRVADLADFEDAFDRPATILEHEPRLSWLLWVVWRALRRADKTLSAYEQWRATVADLDVVGVGDDATEAEERPTSPVS